MSDYWSEAAAEYLSLAKLTSDSIREWYLDLSAEALTLANTFR